MGATAREAHPPVNPLMRAILGLFAAPRINMREDYEKVRRAQRALSWVPRDPERIFDQSVTAHGGHQIPLRIFLPRTASRKGVLLFFHGGGWTIGDIDTYAGTCRTMADLTGQVVCSVDYRLAPEHPYPAGLEDCLEVAETILGHPELAEVDGPEDITLIGDSAGGNLAAAVTLALRARGSALPAAQILLYPVTQWDHDPRTSPFPSVAEYGTGLRLTAAEVSDYVAMYQPDPELRSSPLVSPLLADDLSGLPRTLILTAEYDLLRDEGEAFGAALRAAGTPVRVERVDGALHGFIALPRISRHVGTAYDVINDFLDGGMTQTRELGSPSAGTRR
ncbi:alpha/beta hydrolase [Tessaracoccus oleiagri]|uniref:Acetyl esterase/lipase n=1 Tax=Tessaracoccus oleiagri TaxID=686624 RepID=A0A1G9MII8_9ACTN|nr:alpha/beta hydrolase [Tessaracoccus oleiagri]SDL73821.1 Acetyl esterase/lipase [Tessaracoccus oleiagri]